MLQIIEVKPNTYKVPAIDNRSRKGYAMFQVVTRTLGTPSTAEMINLAGDTIPVQFSATGWRLDCKHPADRVFSWFADGTLCACCCACGFVLAGGAS